MTIKIFVTIILYINILYGWIVKHKGEIVAIATVHSLAATEIKKSDD
jgi:hypothetical protein